MGLRRSPWAHPPLTVRVLVYLFALAAYTLLIVVLVAV